MHTYIFALFSNQLREKGYKRSAAKCRIKAKKTYCTITKQCEMHWLKLRTLVTKKTSLHGAKSWTKAVVDPSGVPHHWPLPAILTRLTWLLHLTQKLKVSLFNFTLALVILSSYWWWYYLVKAVLYINILKQLL